MASAPYTSSRFTPGANAFSFSFFFTDDTFMPAERSGRTSAAATSSPAMASACTTALDIRSVRYCSCAWALVEVVEQPGQRPAVLVLTEAAGQARITLPPRSGGGR